MVKFCDKEFSGECRLGGGCDFFVQEGSNVLSLPLFFFSCRFVFFFFPLQGFWNLSLEHGLACGGDFMGEQQHRYWCLVPVPGISQQAHTTHTQPTTLHEFSPQNTSNDHAWVGRWKRWTFSLRTIGHSDCGTGLCDLNMPLVSSRLSAKILPLQFQVVVLSNTTTLIQSRLSAKILPLQFQGRCLLEYYYSISKSFVC